MSIPHRLLVASMVAAAALPLASAYTIDSFSTGTDRGDSSSSARSVARTRTSRTTQGADATAAAGIANERAVMNYLQHQYCDTLPSAQRVQCLQPLSGSERAAHEATFHAWYLQWMQSAEDQYRRMMEGPSSSSDSSNSPGSSSSASSQSSSAMSLAPAYWQDVNGNWLKIQNGQLVWSTDLGRSWTAVDNRSWQGPDGWYRFDNDWRLLKSVNRTGWEPVDNGQWPDGNGNTFSLVNGALTQTNAAPGSVNAGKWQMSNQEYWSARNNQWVKYMNGRLLWSTDSGASWTEVPGGAWQQANGNWYKFTDSHLQVSTDGGITWQDADDNAWQGPDGIWYKYDANGHLMVRQGTAANSSTDTSNSSESTSMTNADRAQQMRDNFAACQDISPRRRTDCLNRQREMHAEQSSGSTQNQ